MNENIINLDEIKEIVYLGVRRASVFMGLGINAAYDDSFKKYELTDITSMQFVNSNASDSEIKHFKEEFASWITMNGFRELIETLSIFLDKIFNVCLFISSTNSVIDKPNKLRNKFSQKGIEGKLIFLEDMFNIKILYRDCIFAINKARNCLAHRRGILGIEDCDNRKFELKWMSTEIFAQKKTGEITIFELPIPEVGVLLEEGEAIKVRLIEKKLLFNIEEVIRLTPRNLSEICYFIMILTDKIIKEVICFSEISGVIVLDMNERVQ